METPHEIWEALGELPEEELLHVITKLFFAYEEQLNNHPADTEALHFFKRLGNALSQTSQCNLNRRQCQAERTDPFHLSTKDLSKGFLCFNPIAQNNWSLEFQVCPHS